MEKPIIYTAPQCSWCHKEKEWFNENKIEFIEKDVTDEKNAKEIVEKSGQTGTPVTIIGKEILVGFEEDKIKKLLKL